MLKQKKMILFYILLVLKIGRCTDHRIFETKTIGVGQNVTLTCPRQRNSQSTYLFWIRLASGTFPKIFGAAISNDYDVVEKTRHITAKQEPGTFVLHIAKAKFSDTAVYYCINVRQRFMTFSKGIFLRIKGPEPDITAITQDFQSDPVHPGDSVTLQCSVLSGGDKKTCPEEHSVYWFRARPDESYPSLIYAQRSSCDGWEKSREETQKCVYSFSKNVSSSDVGTYYCAVAACGEIVFGNGTKLDIKVDGKCDSKNGNIILFVMCAALAVSLIVIAFLVHVIRNKSCSNAAASLQTIAATGSDNQQSQQRDEDSLVYCTPNITRSKAARRNQRNEETIYTDVRYQIVRDKLSTC